MNKKVIETLRELEQGKISSDHAAAVIEAEYSPSPAEGAEEIPSIEETLKGHYDDQRRLSILKKHMGDGYYKTGQYHRDISEAMQEFATLHARKMARENMREELIKFDVWLTGRGVSVDNVLIIREVDDYLKSKEQ